MRLLWRAASSRRKRTPGSTSNSGELADQPGSGSRAPTPRAAPPGHDRDSAAVARTVLDDARVVEPGAQWDLSATEGACRGPTNRDVRRSCAGPVTRPLTPRWRLLMARLVRCWTRGDD